MLRPTLLALGLYLAQVPAHAGELSEIPNRGFANQDEEILYRRAAERELAASDKKFKALFLERDNLYRIHEAVLRARQPGGVPDGAAIVPGTTTTYEEYRQRKAALIAQAAQLTRLERRSIERGEAMREEYREAHRLAPIFTQIAFDDRAGKTLTGASFLVPVTSPAPAPPADDAAADPAPVSI